MKTQPEILPVVGGKGTRLLLENGDELIDCISSWWVNIHGHAHPHIASAISKQAHQLEHVIFAGFTHEPAVRLSQELVRILPGEMGKIFFSDNGSTAVEVALKMAIQYFHNQGISRKRFIAFEDAYHGDTFGAMSVAGRSTFHQPFEELLFEVDFIPVPVKGKEAETMQILAGLLNSREYAGFIFEPLVQGSAGMIMYEAAILDQVIGRCREKNMLIIADEVFTGFGRTGTLFACDQLMEKPDIICVSKGITGGFMPLGITACKPFIFDAFWSDDKMKAFYHGHSYTGNPLSCAAACASLELFTEETFRSIERINASHREFALGLQEISAFRDVRITGTILALEINTGNGNSYFSSIRDQLYHYFIKKGLLMRPLGNVIYLVPPYCITDAELQKAYSAIRELPDQPFMSLL